MKASDVAQIIESVAPISLGVPGDDLGFLHGDSDVEVTGATTCWSPTLEVIEQSGALGHNMIVAHEPLFFEKRWSGDSEVGGVWFEEYEDADKPVNKQRRAALDKSGACVYRAHSNWDVAPGIGVVDSLISILDLGPVVERGTFTTVHDVPPITVGRLASRVRSRLATGPIRVLGDLDREVRRVGTLIGGLGQMFNAPEQLVRLGADVIVAGECLAYTLRNAQEHGLALMEAGHCACENPGMRAMADWLSQTLSPIPVRFIDSGEPWTVFDG